ncbi:MAG: DNA mismatch repair endonuclease MutL [Thermogutta sp.]
MGRIHRLPQSVVNKIAAGEVIERPASAVKELVENAIDAGASRIDVVIERGGIDVIRVIDNGCGIAEDDLEAAVTSHATSKIADADDLFHVQTLGFRGEALASIAEVSRLLIRSRPAEEEAGHEMTVQGGVRGTIIPCSAPVGTTVEVADLFFNTPVRRRFLRSTATEAAHVAETVAKIALAHPHIHFTLRHGEKSVWALPPVERTVDRIASMFGRELADYLIEVASEDGPVKIHGFVGHPQLSRSNTRQQFLFINGRPIRDRSLQHALSEAYRGLLTVGRQPVAFLYLEMPTDMVDVNVHPTKQEVRFLDGGRLYGQLLGTLRTRFLTSDLNTRVPMPEIADPHEAHDREKILEMRRRVVDWAKGAAPWLAAGESSAQAGTSLGRPAETDVVGVWIEGANSDDAARTAHDPLTTGRDTNSGGFAEDMSPDAPADAAIGEVSSFLDGVHDRSPRQPKAIQVHNRYLIAESDEGVVVIDQHALHERILYEQLRRRAEEGPLESQQLLVPEPVDLSPAEATAALESAEVLAELGMRVEPFGGSTVLVLSRPAMLSRLPPSELLRMALEPMMAKDRAPGRAELIDRILHSMACKAAIKAGDRLSEEEIAALLEQSRDVLDAHHCPHGRPTALIFSREELDKHFKRV